MKNNIALFFKSVLLLLLLSLSFSAQAQFKVIGYMINWGNGPSLINTFDYSKVTHINYAFQNPDASGNLVGSNAGLATLVTKAHAANVKVLVSLGGAGTDYDAGLKGIWQNLITPGNRAGFINKIVAYVNANNLDGADVDIEGSGINADFDGFVNALCDALQPQGKLVTAAVKHDFGNAAFVNTSLSKMNFINIMAYDQTGNWSGTPGQHSSMGYATWMVDYWKGRGVPASKLTLGVPFYGYGWNANPGVWSYAQILASYPGNANTDQAGNIIHYNGMQTIKDKTSYACQNGLGGMMIWELTNDVTGSNSLLDAMRSAMGACGSIPTVSITSPANNASFNAGANITFNANASVSSGSVSKVEFLNGATVIGTDNSSPYSTTWNNVAPGTYTITAKVTSNTNATATASIVIHVIGPFGGTPWPIPGKVEAENYNQGGQGYAYNDVTAGNSGAAYRTEDVDIEPMTTGGFNVGYTAAGEWLKYTVNVTATGIYNFQFNIATTATGKSFHVEIDGANVTGAVNLPNTGAWGTFQVVSVNNVSLTQGIHEMRVYMDTDGFNLDYINVVSLPAPTLTFNNIAKTYGDGVFNAAATSNSPGAITYSIVSGGTLATITPAGQVTIKGAGTVTIQASQAAGGGYNSGTKTATLTINKANLTLKADNKSKVYNTANPALTITYTGFVYGETAAVLSTPASITTTAVTNSNVGTYPIAVSGAAAANYNITLTGGTLTVTQATPTLTYSGPASGQQGTTITLAATSNSTGTLSYTVANGTGSATVAGNQLTLVSAGNVVVTVNLAASTNYTAASITQTITINPLIAPTITFSNISKTYGDGVFTATATSSSPGAITYSIVSGGTLATITSGGQVTIKGSGTVTIQASQVASGAYSSGTATATLTISKANLTIKADNKSKVYNTANPALTITYTGFVYSETATVLSTAASVVTTAATNSNVGTYPITVSGAVAANYTITFTNGTLTVTQATPTLTYSGPVSGLQGSAITLSATSNSTGALSYTVANGTGSATVSANQLNLLAAGNVVVTINLAASTNYTAASITQTITINPLVAPTLTFNNITKTYGDASFTASATSNSPGSITYSIVSGGAFATIAPNGQVTITGAGTVTIQASQAASGSYSARTATALLTIAKANPTLIYTGAFSGLSGEVLTLSATSSSTGSITYEVQTGGSGTASLTGTQLTLGTPGSVIVQLSVAADANYLSGSTVQEIGVQAVTGVTSQAEASLYFTLFPNPAIEDVTLQLNLANNTTGSVVLLDMNGKTVHVIAEGVLAKDAAYVISTTDYASGMYLVKVQTEKGTWVKKMIK